MNILQARFFIFFLVMLIIPGLIAYLGRWDRNLDYLFFIKAFSIAFFLTVAYYLMLKYYGKQN